MKKQIELMVSPFFGGDAVKDEVTGMTFEKNERLPVIYSLPEDTELSGIKKLIQKNILFVVSGLELEEQKKKKAVKLEEVVRDKKEEKAEPVKEEVKEVKEIVEEESDEDLSEKTLRELKEIAKERDIKHSNKITKAELLKKLK